MPIDARSVLCAQLTRDLFAIAKFLLGAERSAPKTCHVFGLSSAVPCAVATVGRHMG